jgi:hypothetical protein
MILVNEGSRRIVLGPAPADTRCEQCGSSQRMIVLSYQVFGFFRFCASWSRRYVLECRQCRTPIVPIARSDFEHEQGNAVPYGHRFGLAVVSALVVVTLATKAIARRGTLVNVALLALWVIAGYACWRVAWESSFSRRRA